MSGTISVLLMMTYGKGRNMIEMIRVEIDCVNGDRLAYSVLDGDLNAKKRSAYAFLREHDHEGMSLRVFVYDEKHFTSPSALLDDEKAYEFLADHKPNLWSERAAILRDLKRFINRATYSMSLDELKETMYLIIARNEEPIAHELYYEPNLGHVIMVQRDLSLEVKEDLNKE